MPRTSQRTESFPDGKGRPPGDRGSALIVVLSVVAVLALMVAHITVSSEVAAREAKVAAERSRLKYVAESASERAFWMLLVDRRKQSNRSLGVTPAEAEGEQEESWMAAGRAHSIAVGDRRAEVRILDADRGLDVSGQNPSAALRTFLLGDNPDFETTTVVERFLDVLLDYIDSGDGDLARLNGRERPDYQAEGWPDLPRNGPLQFREELLWTGAVADLLTVVGENLAVEDVMSGVRLIPPTGRTFPRNSKPSFFSASSLLLQRRANLSAEELTQVLAARQAWQDGKEDLFASLAPDLASRLRQQFAFSESGVVTLVATAWAEDGEMRRDLEVTRECQRLSGARGERQLENWHKFFP